MANISAIKVGSTSYGITATPTSHASTATTYGAATASNYGHVKLSDNYTSSAGAAASGIGASSAAVYNAYNTLNTNKAHVVRKSGSTTSTTNISMRTVVAGALCVAVFEGSYYIGYTRDTSTMIKIASYSVSGMSVAFNIGSGYIHMNITNSTGTSRIYMGSVFY